MIHLPFLSIYSNKSLSQLLFLVRYMRIVRAFTINLYPLCGCLGAASRTQKLLSTHEWWSQHNTEILARSCLFITSKQRDQARFPKRWVDKGNVCIFNGALLILKEDKNEIMSFAGNRCNWIYNLCLWLWGYPAYMLKNIVKWLV